jgi:5-methylcytosine-specific restriction endonuclease McrA
MYSQNAQQTPSMPQNPPRWNSKGKLYIKTSKFRKRLSKKQKAIVLKKYNYCCAMCQKALESFDTEFDHRIPLADDPTSQHKQLLNDIDSFQPLCRRCHGYKCDQERKRGAYNR